MKPRLCSIVVAIALCLISVTARADDGIVFDGVQVANADLNTLGMAFALAMKPNDKSILITLAFHKSTEMPAYDPSWEYRGSTTDASTGKPSMLIWLASDQSDVALKHAIGASVLIALCDTGYGGPNLKRLYDAMTAKDAALPSTSSDPFANRRALADALAARLLHA